MIPEHEELKQQLCMVCNGTGKWKDEVCFRCNGEKVTYWPVRCGGDCSKCSFPPENPKFEVGDIITYGVSGKATIIGIHYLPCAGNMCEYEGGASPEETVTKIASNPKLSSYF